VRKHRLILLAIAASIFLFLPGCSRSRPKVARLTQAEFEWLTDYKKAQEEAKASNKPILVDFTGSDWCPPCILLQKELFSKPEFKDYASKNLVLLEVDFPDPGGSRAKAQPADLQKQNKDLAQQYQVEGFPTIILLNGDGQKLWQYFGYFADGPAAFIAQLEKLRKG
jgi:thioredoxin-related protein